MASPIRIPSRYPAVMGQKWKPCRMCGALTKYVALHFDSGSVAPTDDETLTGATSGDTGVVEETTLISGTYAGGDAAGWVLLSSPTGIDAETLQCFTDDEAINGSVGGSDMMTANGDGNCKYHGILHPKSNIVHKDGADYCIWHFKMKYGDEAIDEYRPDLSESDRGKE